ncbi:MAG: nucleotidyltransferase domain-containing protein [Candidatus Helarchaeota archaeon]
MKKEAVSKLLQPILNKEESINLGYLFGSFIKGGAFRDIDVGIVVKEKNQIPNALKYSMHLGTKFEKVLEYKWNVDVKILNFTPPHFQFAVIRDGQLFFCRDENFRIAYEKTITNLYLDFRETLEWYSQVILGRS